LNVTQRNHIQHSRFPYAQSPPQHGAKLLLVARNDRPQTFAPNCTASKQVSNRGNSFTTPLFSFDPTSAVPKIAPWSAHTRVVFNDVIIGRFRPHQVDELPNPNRSSITVAADAKPQQRPIRQQRPVATEGIRPCTELKLCDRDMKYAGVFDEQPIRSAWPAVPAARPSRTSLSRMRSEMTLCPHPRTASSCCLCIQNRSPIRLVFGAGVCGGTNRRSRHNYSPPSS